MERKKLGLLLLVGGAVVGVVLLFVLLADSSGAGAKEQKLESVQPEIPDGERERLSESKLDAYGNRRGGNRRIDDYWDNIGGDEPKGEDPLADLGVDDAGRPRYKEVTVEDLFGSAESQQAPQVQEMPRERYSRADREAYYEKQRNDMVAHVMAMQAAQQQQQAEAAGQEPDPEPAPVETRDQIDVGKVAVRRSGTVSSMDDGFSSVGSSGISTLDSEKDEFFVDEGYPFKCMFVRQEKLKSGGRVSVRLLEDMVIDGQLVPANTHLMASCTISDRLDLNIASIEIGGRIINLNYDAYDASDGVIGIYCPDVDSQVKEQLKQQAGTTFMTRARTNAGKIAQDVLQAGQIFMTGSGKERTVTVPAGYQFYIVKSKRNG